jgi:nucleoid-associated protein YgaU
LETRENADEGDDVLVSFTLKEYKEYGVTVISTASTTKPTTTSTAEKPRSTASKDTSIKSYTVKSGDCLWNIAKSHYGNGADWKKIYDANKSTIESAAKSHGKQSSSNGHWIYPGTKLTIPAK